MHATNYCMYIIERDRCADLLPITPRAECCVRRKKRDFAIVCHAGGNGGEILFRDADLYESFGKCFLKEVGLCRFRKIGGENNDAGISLPRFHYSLAETLAGRRHG